VVRPLALVAAGLTLLLMGCSESEQEAERAARIVRADVHARGGTCTPAGTATVSEEKVTLYSCTMSGVPPAYREFAREHQSTQRYCYAVVGDYGVAARTMFGSRPASGTGSEGRNPAGAGLHSRGAEI
jgi:hypothetical protein